MNKSEQRFLTLVRSNSMRSFLAAHRVLDDISTPVLVIAASELASRARYLFITDTPEKADNANQIASQIVGVLRSRKEDVSALNAKLDSNAIMF
uniref:Uncharacterized protein n=1 Tax=viral metagenome TaxID=1070528 RepID=A0A6C0JP19_9ZZZZ